MKRIHYHRYGGPEVLRLEEAELAPPSNGQVVIEIRAAAANAMDWKIRNADMRLMTIGRFPRGVGHDVAGVVKAVGQGVTDLHVDAVLGAASMRHAGAFAEAITADQNAVALKPAALSFEQAATCPSSASPRSKRSSTPPTYSPAQPCSSTDAWEASVAPPFNWPPITAPR